MFELASLRFVLGLIALFTTVQGAVGPPNSEITKAAAVERVGSGLYRLGKVRVDTTNREVSVPGRINANVTTLEFVANTLNGWRAYESAVTLDTNAITLNAALLLLGLDNTHVKRQSKFHFDPAPIEGDVVTVSLECPGRECERMPAERLMFDQVKKETVAGGKWIYTGSTFLPTGQYLADADDVVVGFVHDPATIIEYSIGAGLGAYGQIVLNPNIGLAPGTAVLVTIKAPKPPSGR